MKKTFFSLVLGLLLLGNLSFAQATIEAIEDRYEDQIDAMNLSDHEEDRLENEVERQLLNGNMNPQLPAVNTNSLANRREALEDRYEAQIDAMNLPDAQEDLLEAQMENDLYHGRTPNLDLPTALSSTSALFSNCEINGQAVPCDQFFPQVQQTLQSLPIIGQIFTSPALWQVLLWIMGLSVLATFLAFIFWLRMLIDLINHQKENVAIRAVVLIVLNFLGALIYYFTARRTRKIQEKAQMNAPQA